jgi:hypothetical protein
MEPSTAESISTISEQDADREICPISLEPIPKRYLIKLGRHSFDARELDRYVKTRTPGTIVTNPLTREPLTKDQLLSIKFTYLICVTFFDTRYVMSPGWSEYQLEGKCEKTIHFFPRDAIIADLVLFCISKFKRLERLLGRGITHMAKPEYCGLSLQEFFGMTDDNRRSGMVRVGAYCEHIYRRIRRTENFYQELAKMESHRHLVPREFIDVPDVTPTNCTLDDLVKIIHRISVDDNKTCEDLQQDYAEFIEKVKDYRIDTTVYREVVKIIDQLSIDGDYSNILGFLVVDKWNFGQNGCEGRHCTYRHTPPNFNILSPYHRNFWCWTNGNQED